VYVCVRVCVCVCVCVCVLVSFEVILFHPPWPTHRLTGAVLAEGAEDEIRRAMAAHAGCGDAAKAALRDLGCKVELKELWTGTAGLGIDAQAGDRYDDDQ
jgi:hypothetical protein